MKQFMRTIRQGRWHKCPAINWLENGELQSDALCDITTKGCMLSVYRINNEIDRQRVIVALAANRKCIVNLDYAVFEDSALDSLGITVQQTEGSTPDAVANELHYELGNLTVRRLAQLAKIVSAGQHKRISRKRIKLWLQGAANTGHLDRSRITSKKILEVLQ